MTKSNRGPVGGVTSPNFRRGGGGKKPQSAGELLGRLFQAPEVAKKLTSYSAFPFWKDIVGEEIARVAIPEKIIGGRLLKVRVIDAVWAQELTFRKQEIIEGFHRFGQGAIVDDVSFSIGSPKDFKKQ